MKTVILAGGQGTRLSEETESRPKPLVEIGDRPILWHILKIYSHHGIHDFVVCLGYKGYLIKEYFYNYSLHVHDVTLDIRNRTIEFHDGTVDPWKVTLVDTGPLTQTGGRLRRVRDHVRDGTFCFTYGDGVGDIDIAALIRFHRSHGRLATVTAVVPPARFGAIEVDGTRVSSFAEKSAGGEMLINGGFFVLEPKAIDYIDGDASIWEREPLERLAADGELMAYHHTGFWQPMDTLRDRKTLVDLWGSGRAPWKVWA